MPFLWRSACFLLSAKQRTVLKQFQSTKVVLCRQLTVVPLRRNSAEFHLSQYNDLQFACISV